MTTPEFTFELRVCQWAERHWPPTSEPSVDGDTNTDTEIDTDADNDRVCIARQLGTKHRRWDTIIIETDRRRLAARARFGSERLDSDLLHVVRNAPSEWAYYRSVLPDPGYPWRYVRDAIHTATDRGIIENRRRGNRIEIRRKWAYPDWVRRIVAIENKPDLDASAADSLSDQLQRDVAVSLADEVWVATRATGATVEPALLECLPIEVGILTMDEKDTSGIDVAVAWHPRSLDSDGVGTRILERPTGSEYDRSAARFEYVDTDWKTTKRLEIAERAYERGWRSYVDTMRPDCRHFTLCCSDDSSTLPWCVAKDRSQTSAECSNACPSFEPEPPGWRTRGWPIEGGPGAGLKRLLEHQRNRQR